MRYSAEPELSFGPGAHRKSGNSADRIQGIRPFAGQSAEDGRVPYHVPVVVFLVAPIGRDRVMIAVDWHHSDLVRPSNYSTLAPVWVLPDLLGTGNCISAR